VLVERRSTAIPNPNGQGARPREHKVTVTKTMALAEVASKEVWGHGGV
jgi:hypothetical protein